MPGPNFVSFQTLSSWRMNLFTESADVPIIITYFSIFRLFPVFFFRVVFFLLLFFLCLFSFQQRRGRRKWYREDQIVVQTKFLCMTLPSVAFEHSIAKGNKIIFLTNALKLLLQSKVDSFRTQKSIPNRSER